ncbi:hypothetical protein RHSIM_Rhsim10G0161900 [Rhododendron simsii]|uniref:U2A'/phosphoprotein 32 family A C-terminal domain-containing protein n=1 Tax=Rhododendron simsii TaxID=118357 RepID=A0A834GFN1_RHOSS|nr:hypothetical protein RHSIM_Rhsim10G0161900 [Rhododendron simsii]
MVIASLSTSSSTTHHLLQYLRLHLSHPHNPKPHFLSHLYPTHHHNSKPFSSQPLSSQPLNPNPSPDPPPQLVNDLSRTLSDYRNPHHDLESALTPFSPNISTNLVEQVLKRCKNLGFSAHRFFLWALRHPGFKPTKETHHILVSILGSSKQFPLIWDFLAEWKDTQCCEIEPEIFWVVFRAYSRANLPADAIRAFGKMADFGVEFGNDDVDKLLYELCKRKHVRHAQGFFDRVKSEVEPSAKSYSILMRGWGDIGESGEARKLFDEMLESGCCVDLLAYNSMLQSLCKGGSVEEAYKLFREMGSKGLEPDAFTYSIFIHAACDANDIHSAFRVLDRMKRYELVPNVYTYNAIIKRLCKNDRVEEAYLLLDEMIERGERPDVWSYNTILACHCDHNEVNKALRLISRMDQDSCLPDWHTYNMVIKMLIRIGRFDRVTKVWESMEERGFYPSASTYAVMVHSFCKKKGKLEDACRYFEIMVDEGIPPYSSTCEMLRNRLVGLGFSEQTHILADKMERSTSCSIQELSDIMRDDFRPNGGSYWLLQSCSSLSFNMLKVNVLACYISENETVYSDVIPQWNGLVDLQTEILGCWQCKMRMGPPQSPPTLDTPHLQCRLPKKYIVCHPSPICYEKHYREYMVASLPTLKVLDNLSIEKTDKERANGIFSQHFESLPYKRKNKASVVSILHKREIRASCTNSQNWRRKPLYVSAKSQYFFSRSLSAAIVGSSAWPLLHPLSISGDESRSFRPWQFEYHPSDLSLVAFGTLDGEVVASIMKMEKLLVTSHHWEE